MGHAKRHVRRIADFATPPKRNAHFCMKMYKKSQGQTQPLTLRIKNKGGGSKSRFRLLGRLGGVLGVLWAFLERSWAVLGPSWGSPGELLDDLGASWDGLRAVLGRQG